MRFLQPDLRKARVNILTMDSSPTSTKEPTRAKYSALVMHAGVSATPTARGGLYRDQDDRTGNQDSQVEAPDKGDGHGWQRARALLDAGWGLGLSRWIGRSLEIAEGAIL